MGLLLLGQSVLCPILHVNSYKNAKLICGYGPVLKAHLGFLLFNSFHLYTCNFLCIGCMSDKLISLTHIIMIFFLPYENLPET